MKPHKRIIAGREAEKREEALKLLDVVVYSNPELDKHYTIKFLLEQIADMAKQAHDELWPTYIDTFIDVIGWSNPKDYGEEPSLPYQRISKLFSKHLGIVSTKNDGISKIAQEALDPQTVNTLNNRLIKIVEWLHNLEKCRKDLFLSLDEGDIKITPNADLDKKIPALRELIFHAQQKYSGISAFEERHTGIRLQKLARNDGEVETLSHRH